MVSTEIENEKHPDLVQVLTDEKDISLDEYYDYDDPRNYSTNYTDDHNPRGLRRPTDHESKTLRRVIGNIRYSTFILCVCEFAERASYYSTTGILTNYIQRRIDPNSPHGWGAPPPGNPDASAGALGRGLQTASALTNLLTFLAYVFPLLGGYYGDSTIGRWKAIQWGVFFGFVGHLFFIFASIPQAIEHSGAGLGLCIIAIITLSAGTGFIKPNLLPLLLDQYPEDTDVVKVLPSGEKIILDREKTLSRLTNVFYLAINLGAFLQIATSYCERRVGFWLAFFVPMILYIIMPIFLFIVKPKLKIKPPESQVMPTVLKIISVVFSGNFFKRIWNGTFWEYAKPSNMRERGREFYNTKKKSPITWNDQWVLDIKQTFDSCKIFIYYIVFNLADSGLGSVETSLIGAMKLDGVPNDLFNNFNPLTIIVLIPLLEYGLYPILNRFRIEFRPIYRISFGFVVCSFSQIAGYILQKQVYEQSPCGYYATGCDQPAPITAWKATSLFILSAAGECWAYTTAYELAYTRSPPALKSLVYALFLLMSAFSAALSLAITPALKDPNLHWVFLAIGLAGFACAVVMLIQFWNLHKWMDFEFKERERLDREEEDAKKHELTSNIDHPIEAIASLK
ncbi:PTR2 Peptide transporter PTR2 [Candida maltosa Xu316]|uniref:Peptide transporter PTR2 n=1 Tax=Candida maltosa (strain Xu316) TaxID=1245528 RepID=M3JQZ1_CANMX|nr:Peptide transporter PTR2 [Candida maltosa Xu316]